jgi:hypothetical protein
MATDINDLQLSDEPVGEVDYDAPEAGSGFPPTVAPGVHDFLFKLEDDPFESFEKDGRKYLQVNHRAVFSTENPENGSIEEHELRFQRASFYQSQRMKQARMNAKASDLIRALGVRVEGPLSPSVAVGLFKEADGRGHYRAQVEWRRYCKGCETTVSTRPNKKKGDTPWPRDAKGALELIVECPKCHEKGYGNAEISDYKLPGSGA